MRWLALLALSVVLPLPVAAERAWRDDVWEDEPDRGWDRPYPEVPPVEPTWVRRADVAARLETAELEGCLDTAPGAHRATVRVHIDADGTLAVLATTRPESEEISTCLRRAAETALLVLSPMRARRTIELTRRLRSEGSGAPPASLESAVRGREEPIFACVTREGAPPPGALTLTMRVRRGHLALREARIGSFVADAAAVACLEALLAPLSTDAPPGEVTVTFAERTPG